MEMFVYDGNFKKRLRKIGCQLRLHAATILAFLVLILKLFLNFICK